MLSLLIVATSFAVTSYASSRLLLQATGETICTLPPGAPGSCAGAVSSPPGGVAPFYKLYCQSAGACQGGTFYLYTNADKMEGAWFTEQNSGYGATVNIGSMNPGMVTQLNRIECSAPGACVNMVVNLVNGEIGDFVCAVAGACDGCMIYDWKNPTTPVSTPCMQVAKLEWL